MSAGGSGIAPGPTRGGGGDEMAELGGGAGAEGGGEDDVHLAVGAVGEASPS